jgi:hypothetical protein
MDVASLADLLKEAADQHHRYEATAPEHEWSAWYAAYVNAREQGRSPEEAYSAAGVLVESAPA